MPPAEGEPRVTLIAERIVVLRGQRVLIDADLAALYGVSTKALNQAFKRNIRRFPPDFAFRISDSEKSEVVTICHHLARIKFSKVRPTAFTEHGSIMAATVLHSPRAVEMSVYVVRALMAPPAPKSRPIGFTADIAKGDWVP